MAPMGYAYIETIQRQAHVDYVMGLSIQYYITNLLKLH